MAINTPTEAHKATIRRHYSESVALGATPEQVHGELHNQIFSQVGKYSMAQITATTSWIAGEILRGKRVNEVTWDEGANNTNEDADFDNPEKNAARNWQIQQLLLHTTAEGRQKMHQLLLPGQNEFDFRAFIDAGMQAENFLTYIRGEHPKAVAQYLRNCRKYGVQNKRVGEMNEHFPHETAVIQGAYIDYFSQFCPDTSLDAHLLPLDANHDRICLGFNFKKGREHDITKENANRNRLVREHVDKNKHATRNGLDLLMLYSDGAAIKGDEPYEMRELRDDLIYQQMFSFAGIAQQRNWTALDLVRSSTKADPGNEDFDGLPMIEQYLRVRQHLKNLAIAGGIIDKYGDSLRIDIWLSEAAAAVSRAVINTPIVKYLAEPFSYKSGQSGMPFRSYFGVLETRKDKYQKYMPTIEFIFALGEEISRRLRPASTNGHVGQIVIDVNDVVRVTGVGEKKRITVLKGAKPIAEINQDTLIESTTELGISSCSVDNPKESFEKNRREDLASTRLKKQRGKMEQVQVAMMQQLLRTMRGRVENIRIKRNDPCPCGSGQKFKKCCMEH
jgi:hypothetical protein